MPSANVSNVELLVRGLRTEFDQTYSRMVKGVEAQLSRVMDLNIPSDKLSEIYGYYETAPHWKRWNRGEEIPRAGFRSRNFEVLNHDWGLAIDWHDNDEQDDQSKGLVSRVRQGAMDAALLAERVFFQILTGGTDNNLLPAVPTAPDGANFFATTASSSARFGATGGNSLTSSGISTPALIQADFFAAWSQFRKFLDTDSQPLFPASMVDRGVTIIYNVANEQVFRQAFMQTYNAQVFGANTAAAAPTNVILDSNMAVNLWSTPRITDNSWYIFLNNAPHKCVFQQVRQPPRDNLWDMTNSDFSRRTKIKGMQWDARYGFGLALPYSAIKIS